MVTRILHVGELAQALFDQACKEIEDAKQGGHYLKVVALCIGDSAVTRYQLIERQKICSKAEISFHTVALSENASQIDVDGCMSDLSRDNGVTAISFLNGHPSTISRCRVLRRMASEKDVEGVHPQTMARLFSEPEASTASPLCSAVSAAITTHEIDLYDRHVLIYGSTRELGLPLSALLCGKHCRLTLVPTGGQIHSSLFSTADLIILGAQMADIQGIDAIRHEAVLFELGASLPSAICQDPESLRSSGKCGAGRILPAGEISVLEGAMFLCNLLECYRLRIAGGLKGGSLAQPENKHYIPLKDMRK